MKSVIKNNGFSLTEVLMAVGILSIGIMLVATMFPAAIYLTAVASEKTMASIVADEAFAKMQLFGIDDPCNDPHAFIGYWKQTKIDSNEFIYPSLDGNSGKPQYSWSAICKKLNDDSQDKRYLVKLYVTRKTGSNLKYFKKAAADPNSDWPVPIVADVQLITTGGDKMKIEWGKDKYVNPPPSTAIIDYASGRIFRIISRNGNEVTLDRNWDKDLTDPNYIWFMPSGELNNEPAGKNPDIDVFQKIIDFKK